MSETFSACEISANELTQVQVVALVELHPLVRFAVLFLPWSELFSYCVLCSCAQYDYERSGASGGPVGRSVASFPAERDYSGSMSLPSQRDNAPPSGFVSHASSALPSSRSRLSHSIQSSQHSNASSYEESSIVNSGSVCVCCCCCI